MGLFNLFKKNINSKSTIRDIDDLKLLNFNELIKTTKIIEEKKFRTDGYLITHEYVFNQSFLGAFNRINFQIFKQENGQLLKDDKGKIKLVKVTFFNNNIISSVQMKNVVNSFMQYIDNDDLWTDVDDMRIASGIWRGRTVLKDFTLFIRLDDNLGFIVELIGLNKFLDI